MQKERLVKNKDWKRSTKYREKKKKGRIKKKQKTRRRLKVKENI